VYVKIIASCKGGTYETRCSGDQPKPGRTACNFYLQLPLKLNDLSTLSMT